MEFNELINVRRSVRSYDSSISKQDIETIISKAQLAPSWKNSQTGRYYVAISEDMISKVYECLPEFNQKSSKNAAYIISTFKKGISGDGNDYWGSYDLGLQNSYLVLAASQLGYDTLIMGLRDEDELRKLFNIPDDEMLLPVIAIGKSSVEKNLRPRKQLDEILEIR